MRPIELLRQFADDDRARGVRESLQLVQVLAQVRAGVTALERGSDQERPLDGLFQFDWRSGSGDRALRYRDIVLNCPVAEYGTVKLPTTEPTVTSPATL